MDSSPEHRERFDQLVLEFETRWTIEHAADLIYECYSKLPCNELLVHLIAADCELALRLNVVRSSEYYLARFPTERAKIEQALSDVDLRNLERLPSTCDDPLVELASYFFKSLPCDFGPYRVVRCLAGGGMAAVFEATIDNQTVALKLPYRMVFGARKLQQRFQREISLLVKLAHPNIIPVLDSGVIEGVCYYTMPLIKGEDLSTKCTLERLTTLSPHQAARYILQAAEAVAYSHSQGILHRDIKPSNILVDEAEHVWILDFGLGSYVDSHHSMTVHGKLLGTPAWMSPEHTRGKLECVDERADIYSLGATLYSVLTGRTPFSGTTTTQLLLRIQNLEVLPPRHLRRDVPKALETIVLKCMEKQPSRRYANCTHLAEDLRNFVSGSPVRAVRRNRLIRAYRWARLYPKTSISMLASVLTMFILSAAVIALQHVAQLQRQVATNAESLRDAALRSEAEQITLRNLADREKRKAQDAASFAEVQQMRMAFSQAATELKDGRVIEADIFRYSKRYSIDSQLYEKYINRRPLLIRSFCTGRWGHYDAAINNQRGLLATAGRDGNVCVWDVASGTLKHQYRHAEIDSDKGSTWNRWRYHTGNTDGFTPQRQPEFYSSLTWSHRGTLLITDLDGTVVEFSDHGGERLLWKSEKGLLFIRSHPSRSEVLVVDEEGTCSLLDADGAILSTSQLGISPSWAGHAALVDRWIVGSEGGDLFVLDAELDTNSRLATGSQVRDVRVFELDSSVHALVTCKFGGPRWFEWKSSIEALEPAMQRNVGPLESTENEDGSQALLDHQSKLVVHLSEGGRIRTSTLEDDRVVNTFSNLAAPRDIRHPYPNEVADFDSLERRARCFMFAGSQGIIIIDSSGTFREFDFTHPNELPKWQQLSTVVGEGPRIGLDPNIPDHLWALDLTGALRLVSISSGELLAERLQAHHGGYSALKVLNNGSVLTAGNDCEIRRWEFKDGAIQEVGNYVHQQPLLSVACHEQKGLIGSVTAQGDLVFFDLRTGESKCYCPEQKADTANFSVHTGRIAFSKSGRYATAFTRSQDCITLDLESFSVASTIDYDVADSGGVDVCFSPLVETRFIYSSNGTSSNEIESVENDANPAILQMDGLPYAVDFEPTADEQRIAALLADGNLAFFSPEHFVHLSTWDTPATQPSSMAIANGNNAIVVATTNGEIYCRVLGTVDSLTRSAHSIDGQFSPVKGLDANAHVSFGTLNGLEVVQDANGHLTALFRIGGYTAKSRQNQLVRLIRDSEGWKLAPICFAGSEEGPGEYGGLFPSPNGGMVAVVRQGSTTSQDYNGRTLLLRERVSGDWESEVLQTDGNAGFCPVVLFGEDKSVTTVLHFDFEWQRFLAHHRSADGSWSRKTLDGQVGFRARGVRDRNGGTHLIARHLRGFDSLPPHQYLHIDLSGKVIQHQSEGEIPLLHGPTGALFSYEPSGGNIWKKMIEFDTGNDPSRHWQSIGRIPQECPTASPALSDTGDFWYASCQGNSLVIIGKNILSTAANQEWNFYQFPLEMPFALTTSTACNINHQGNLEVLLFSVGEPTSMAVIELVLPVNGQ